MRCTQAGMSDMGTRRPDRISSSGEEQLVDGAHPRGPEGDHPQQRQQHGADQVGAPDGKEEDHHLQQVGCSSGLKINERTTAMGSHSTIDDDFPAGKIGHIAVDGMDRAQQLAGELARWMRHSQP